MDFVQTMKDWRRMCKTFTTDDDKSCCEGCPIMALEIDEHGCDAIFSEWADKADWEEVEDVIETWAEEHSEPVYPRWIDWLANVGLIIDAADHYTFNFTAAGDQIPSEIAVELGIDPKEG